MSSSFLPLLAFELSCAARVARVNVALGEQSGWLPCCVVPEPRLSFPLIQLGPKDRRGHLRLCAAIGIRERELGIKCHVFCLVFPDISQLFLACAILSWLHCHVLVVRISSPRQADLKDVPSVESYRCNAKPLMHMWSFTGLE